MDTFHALLQSIKNDCAWEHIPADKIAALARMCGPKEINELIQELEQLDDADLEGDVGDGIDEYWRLRSSISRVLGLVGDAAVSPLIQALQSENPRTRGYAAAALGMTGAKQSFEPIATLLQIEPDFDTKLQLIEALGGLGDPRAVDVLLPYLHAPQQNRGWLIRITAHALGRIGTDAVLQPLCNVLASDPDWFARLGAAEGLGHMREERAIGALCNALTDRDGRVRGQAKESLRELGIIDQNSAK
jgi:HEAT repeat protein